MSFKLFLDKFVINFRDDQSIICPLQKQLYTLSVVCEIITGIDFCTYLGHIQPGNVILEKGTAKLVDIENCLIGQPSIYRHHLLEVRKIYVS